MKGEEVSSYSHDKNAGKKIMEEVSCYRYENAAATKEESGEEVSSDLHHENASAAKEERVEEVSSDRNETAAATKEESGEEVSSGRHHENAGAAEEEATVEKLSSARHDVNVGAAQEVLVKKVSICRHHEDGAAAVEGMVEEAYSYSHDRNGAAVKKEIVEEVGSYCENEDAAVSGKEKGEEVSSDRHSKNAAAAEEERVEAVGSDRHDENAGDTEEVSSYCQNKKAAAARKERAEEVNGGRNHDENASPQPLSGKKLSWYKLRSFDSLDIECRHYGSANHHASKNGGDWLTVLHLAFQSIGVVYGDMGTSPLYVYSSTFTGGIKHNDDILGVLSLIFYTITLIPLLKYVFIVLRANDNGHGGTFAMYSLICRHAKVGLIGSEEATDQDVSNELPNSLKSKLEKSKFAKVFLLFAALLGSSIVIGDGILTPCMSVLSAVGGIKEATDAMTEWRIVFISVGILVCLFAFQRLGADKVGYTFAPVILIWFAFIAGIGLFNLIKFDPAVVKALNPAYIVSYFGRNKKNAWISLGGIVLSMTGTEALFADVGHFSVRSIQISMCTAAYPALVLAYTGQASYLRKNRLDISNPFFKSIPGPLYWPVFVMAIMASIVSSQAMITATFSMVQQSLSLGCFPPIKVIQTSTKHAGQVYIPMINYLLMLACIAVTIGFRTPEKIGNAYGIAVVFVMNLTSAFLVLIMILIWKTKLFLVVAYVVVIGSVELLYLSSVLYKFDQGGYLPLAFAMVIMVIMILCNKLYRKKMKMIQLPHSVLG